MFIFRSDEVWIFEQSSVSKRKGVYRDDIKAWEMWENLLETSQVTPDKIKGKFCFNTACYSCT